MSGKLKSKFIFGSGVLILTILMGIGIQRAFSRGGNDFSVFYEAWKLVFEEKGDLIYQVSPDRFLYSPGFAWLLAPIGVLPRQVALALWCIAKIAAVFFIVVQLSREFGKKYTNTLNKEGAGNGWLLCLGLSIWGVILIARPLLIDFEYGQVNLFIVAICLWALLGHFSSSVSVFWDGLRWFGITFFAITKLFPLPLLVTPWIVTPNQVSKQKLRNEKLGILIGLPVSLLLPAISLGWSRYFHLLVGWKNAIRARGLPLESHNQSFSALLHHFFGGAPTHVQSHGSTPVLLGYPLLSDHSIGLLGLFWISITIGITMGWILCGSRRPKLVWIPIAIGLLIIPGHLVWKAYFVMSMPLAITLVHLVSTEKQKSFFAILFLLFLGINFTGFDFVGNVLGMYFESASLFLLIHLAMMFLVYRLSIRRGESVVR